MRKLLFFSRVAFICNVCFLVTFLMQYSSWIPTEVLSSTILILGNVFALFVNFGVNIFYGIFLLNKRALLLQFPRWLVIANFLFFMIQLILLLK
jgi:hypothetical protein